VTRTLAGDGRLIRTGCGARQLADGVVSIAYMVRQPERGVFANKRMFRGL
jgi:hypothetical protein